MAIKWETHRRKPTKVLVAEFQPEKIPELAKAGVVVVQGGLGHGSEPTYYVMERRGRVGFETRIHPGQLIAKDGDGVSVVITRRELADCYEPVVDVNPQASHATD